MNENLPERIAELEAELKQRDAKIKDLTKERDEAQELVDTMREQVESGNDMIEQWIDVFEMQQDERGIWIFDSSQSELWESYDELLKHHKKTVDHWNRYLSQFNAIINPRPIGRPLAASDGQQKDVLKRRKAGNSLRAIAEATSLSVRTVRSVLAQKKRTNKLRRLEFDRHRAAAYRARRRGRDQLPEQIAEQLKSGANLVKAAKGIGR